MDVAGLAGGVQVVVLSRPASQLPFERGTYVVLADGR